MSRLLWSRHPIHGGGSERETEFRGVRSQTELGARKLAAAARER